MGRSLRWAVSLKETLSLPNFEELFRKAIFGLPEEDVKSQRAFRYKQDSLACIIGRILIRKATCDILEKSWPEITFERTGRGKPYLKNSPPNYHFNISHHGDLVVLATENVPVGIDVMRIEKRRSETAEEHIMKLKRQFTEQEIETMLGFVTELDRWRAFYRIWCLKEAILKATGIGLTDNLRKYDFWTKPNHSFEPGCYLTSTRYFHEKIEQKSWRIEECFIDLLYDVQFLSPDLDDIEEFEIFDVKPDKHF
ncbi:unnamed protein product [Caenorhabditis angaria]|uniref:L-aminoadipate-semialdehyde dehydrogenase-phosphopantetheinyl transferase n=1 Tax=Caenorhabditis angaria TaxID=860376 RepID=A0A9P1N5I4_9PELO|nr:unnamed protein product [Caenorhabditis angaria]